MKKQKIINMDAAIARCTKLTLTAIGVFLMVPTAFCQLPTSATFDKSTHWRSSDGTDGKGDNNSITWAADGNQYVNMSDGVGWGTEPYRSQLWRITGTPDNIGPVELPNYPAITKANDQGLFCYGTASIDGTIYQWLSLTRNTTSWSAAFHGLKLIYSSDNGNSWYNHLGTNVSNTPLDKTESTMLNWHLDGAVRNGEGRTGYAFAWMEAVQCEQDNSLAKDDYVYFYSSYTPYPEQLNLCRVHKNNIKNWSSYEFYQSLKTDGTANWTSDVTQRGIVTEYPTSQNGKYSGWYSWLPSVVYNEPLDLYIMSNGATYGTGMTDTDTSFWSGWVHAQSGSLGLYYSKNPWGPWTEFFFDDSWVVDDPSGNRTYQPKLSPKWISADGTEMWLIYSDAGDPNGKRWGEYYSWNHIKFTITVSNNEPPSK